MTNEQQNGSYDDFTLFEKFGITLSELQKSQLAKYYNLLVTENAKYNLTSITEINEIYEKHFLDSMLGGKFIKENAKVCDIGAGGGFPSIPLKILRPDLEFLLVDSTNKKINFLNLVIEELNLTNMETIHSRIEEIGHSNRRASFDVVVSRGVAPLPTLLEYKMPLVKVGGIALCYKGDVDKELEISENALKTFHCHKISVEKFTISKTAALRAFLIVEKSVDSPKSFPRPKNLPRLQPL